MKPTVPHLEPDEIARRYGLDVETVKTTLAQAREAMTPWTKHATVVEGGTESSLAVTRKGVGILSTPYGRLWIHDFRINDEWEKYSVLVHCPEVDALFMPRWKDRLELTIRTDSGCGTGQVFHDETCECREQLHYAMEEIIRIGEGMIIHIPNQDGRGKGTSFKLATLILQDVLGVHTVESASMLAKDGDIDVRTYAGVVGILKFFQITNNTYINLATNNPDKSHALIENGYRLASFKPVIIPPTTHTARHLEAKKFHLGHQGIGSATIINIGGTVTIHKHEHDE